MTKRYKIRVKGGGTLEYNDEYDVWENGPVTHVMWRNDKGTPFSLAYQTRSVIQYLKEGRWIKVESKKEKKLSLSKNLFDLDDI